MVSHRQLINFQSAAIPINCTGACFATFSATSFLNCSFFEQMCAVKCSDFFFNLLLRCWLEASNRQPLTGDIMDKH